MMRTRKIQPFFCTAALLLTLVPSSAGASGPERHGFDAFVTQTQVRTALAQYGIQITSDDDQAVRVVDTAGLGGVAAHSGANALIAARAGGELRIDFTHAKAVVEVFVGGVGENTGIVLEAYDDDGILIEHDEVAATSGSEKGVVNSLGVKQPNAVIRRVVLRASDQTNPMVLDDLSVSPSQEESVADLAGPAAILLQGDSPAKQLDALAVVATAPSPGAASLLSQFLAQATDAYVKERAVLTLLAMGAAEDIAALIDVANAAVDPGLRRTTLNAAWTLRQRFPHAKPPQIELSVVSEIMPGEVVLVRAEIHSPVARAHAQISLDAGRGLELVPERGRLRYTGALETGTPVVLEGAFIPDGPGWTSFDVEVVIVEQEADLAIFRESLFLEVTETGGAATSTMDPAIDLPATVVLDGDSGDTVLAEFDNPSNLPANGKE